MKRNMMKLMTMGTLAAGMMFAQAPTPAQPANPPAGRHGYMARHRANLAQKLNLTDAQKQQAKAIFQQTRQSTQALRQQLKENRQAMAAAIKANNTADMQRLSTVQGTLMGQVLAARSQAKAQVYSLLTPEQKAQADQLQQQRFQTQHHRKNG
jgi:Spy/CpxP family protein refolding chaperone